MLGRKAVNDEQERALILAIDPGSTESGVVIIDRHSYKPIKADKVPNDEALDLIHAPFVGAVVVEMIASYGMPVGAEVFETCVTIGRIEQLCDSLGMDHARIYRQEEKLTICHSPRANDATIRQALIDRFAPGVRNHGKGTKSEPGWFYGFRADSWQAYAVGVTFLDKEAMR